MWVSLKPGVHTNCQNIHQRQSTLLPSRLNDMIPDIFRVFSLRGAKNTQPVLITIKFRNSLLSLWPNWFCRFDYLEDHIDTPNAHTHAQTPGITRGDIVSASARCLWRSVKQIKRANISGSLQIVRFPTELAKVVICGDSQLQHGQYDQTDRFCIWAEFERECV